MTTTYTPDVPAFTIELLAALEAEGYAVDHGGTGGNCTAAFVIGQDTPWEVMLTDGDASYPTGDGGCVALYIDGDYQLMTMAGVEGAAHDVADMVAAVRAAVIVAEHGGTVDVDTLGAIMTADRGAGDGSLSCGESDEDFITRWSFDVREAAFFSRGDVIGGFVPSDTDVVGQPPFGDQGDAAVILWAMAVDGDALTTDTLTAFYAVLADQL